MRCCGPSKVGPKKLGQYLAGLDTFPSETSRQQVSGHLLHSQRLVAKNGSQGNSCASFDSKGPIRWTLSADWSPGEHPTNQYETLVRNSFGVVYATKAIRVHSRMVRVSVLRWPVRYNSEASSPSDVVIVQLHRPYSSNLASRALHVHAQDPSSFTRLNISLDYLEKDPACNLFRKTYFHTRSTHVHCWDAESVISDAHWLVAIHELACFLTGGIRQPAADGSCTLSKIQQSRASRSEGGLPA